ncbi:hypothetical protein OEZ86_006503 [Tetradesmus obliquus]|nr:hypothetical protein OEZ86_006503 [Tetradesmus obliquus]
MPGRDKDSFINPEYFKEDFSVDAFLVKLTQDVIDSSKQQGLTTQGGRPITSEESARATIDRVQKLIQRFIQAEYEISKLGHDVAAKLVEVQQSANEDETDYKAEVRTLERVSERIKDGIRDIDARATRISQTATRVGDRLQTAEGLRLRCLEAQELISHLQAFSCHSAGEDFSKLPAIFTNDATLAEAAAVSRRLVQLAGEVAAAQQRSKAASSSGAPRAAAAKPGKAGGIGSVEHTLKVLEAYCNWLENRVVARFDAAVAECNLRLQAQSVAIMIELDKERSIAQRWVASRPAFLAFSPEMLDDWVRRASRQPPLPPPGALKQQQQDAEAAAVAAGEPGAGSLSRSASGADPSKPPQQQPHYVEPALPEEYDIVVRQAKALSGLYKEVHASVKDDVAEAAQVFSEPGLVLEMFMSRLLEQNVQAALERLLLPSGPGMAALAASTNAIAAATAAPGADRTSNAANLTLRERARERASSIAASFSGAPTGSAGSGSAGGVAAAGGSTGGVAGSGGSFSGGGPPPAALQRQQLRLLAEAYSKTQRLALNLERVVRGVAQVDVLSMAEGLWPAFMGSYPGQELSWLAAAYQEEVQLLDSPELNLNFCLKLMAWNAEATARALKLSAPPQAPRNCRMLFHHLVAAAAAPGGGAAAAAGGSGASSEGNGSGGGAGAAAAGAAPTAHPGCLLEHLAKHIIGGVEFSLELCNVGGPASLGGLLAKMGLGGVISRASAQQVAAAFVGGKVRKALEAAHAATQVVAALQSHYSSTVAPAVSGSVAELSAASSALLALIRAAEDSITAVLRKSVDTFMTQMERALTSEQRRSDFTPRDDVLSFDQPTAACLLGTALLAALRDAAGATLEGPNRKHFLTEVSRRSYQLLLAHMSRYTYSPTGALKWKKDVNEYAEVLASFGVPSASEDMGQLLQLVNVLVVAPDSLLGLVNGSLRMAHRDALRFIALREDFRTAKVDGKTLLQLFSGEGMEGQLGQQR